jgi:dUTPase
MDVSGEAWQYSRIRDVKPMVKGTPDSVGCDVFIPTFDAEFIAEFEKQNADLACMFVRDKIVIQPFGRVKIPSGLKFRFATKQKLETGNRSGHAMTKGLVFGAHIVDPDYQNEYFIGLINTSPDTVYLESGIKIVQLVRSPVFTDMPTEVPVDQLYSEVTVRGQGGFGSTGV